MARSTTILTTTILVAVPTLAQAAPSSAQRVVSDMLAEGVAMSGVRFQRQAARDPNGRALWVGLQVQSGQHQYRLQLDAVRLATSALPAGRTIRGIRRGCGVGSVAARP